MPLRDGETASTVLGGARVVTPESVLDPGWVQITAGVITDVGGGRPPGPAEDLHGAWVLPGFVDLHMHGGGGHDAARSPQDLAGAVRFHLAHGTTSTLVSLVAAPVPDLQRRLAWIAETPAPTVVGAHLEGPFLAGTRRGAQNPAFLLEPSVPVFDRLATPALRMITLAPERPGAHDVIAAARAVGVTVALGHSDATYAEGLAAVDAGATVLTHLFNGMRPLHHREPGLIGVALDTQVWFELICDGQHLHPAVVRLMAACAPERLVLVTDAIDAAGLGDGRTVLGGQDVDVTGGVARLHRSGALAGSTLTMDAALRHAVRDIGLDIGAAARAAATTPARALGIHESTEAIRSGLAADVVVLDDHLQIVRVLVRGEPVDA